MPAPNANRLSAGPAVDPRPARRHDRPVNGGDRIAEALQRHGVRALFTLCGGHISPILVGCKRRGIRVVDVRHEATAVFAADATARLSGQPGVAAVTAGPGASNAITALKNAQLAESPVLVLGGATATALRGRGALQDIDQRALLAPHVKAFHGVTRAAGLLPAVDAALREARGGVPGPVFVECPVDLLYDEATVRSWYLGPPGARPRPGLAAAAERFYLRRHLARLFAGADAPAHDAGAGSVAVPREPAASVVRKAAGLLAACERPVLLVGSQALPGPDLTAPLAEAVAALGVPTYLSGMARGLLGPSHPLHVRHRRREALREADLVILAGAPCDFRLDYGRQIGRRAQLVAANRDARAARRNRRPAVAAVGEPSSFLRRLAARAGGPAGRFEAWAAALRARDQAREREIDAQAAAPAEGVSPIALLRLIDARLPDDSAIVADGGDFVATAAYLLRPRRPLSWLDPGVFGTLGVGAGFALGARLLRPGAEIFALFGDGAFGYGLAEIDSFARHGLGLVAIVGNDASWAQIARDQVELLGDPVGTALAPADYERAAAGLGAAGYRVERIEEAADALEAARADARAGRPAVLNVRLGRSEFRKGALSL